MDISTTRTTDDALSPAVNLDTATREQVVLASLFPAVGKGWSGNWHQGLSDGPGNPIISAEKYTA
jgi:hypothetical protein